VKESWSRCSVEVVTTIRHVSCLIESSLCANLNLGWLSRLGCLCAATNLRQCSSWHLFRFEDAGTSQVGSPHRRFEAAKVFPIEISLHVQTCGDVPLIRSLLPRFNLRWRVICLIRLHPKFALCAGLKLRWCSRLEPSFPTCRSLGLNVSWFLIGSLCSDLNAR
jgi:hypothetical protein